MNQGQIIDIAQRAMYVAAVTTIPILLVCLVIGIIVSIFQAVTQIHEQSLAFVPKIVVVLVLLAFAGNWLVGQLASFTREVFSAITRF
jgi:flagellar biosynthetic protein FliQ